MSIPAEMNESSDLQQQEPAADLAATASGAAAGRAKLARSARSISATGPLVAVIVVLAGAVGALVLRDLNRIDADIAGLGAEVSQLRVDMDARFDALASDVDAKFDDVNARFDDVDARFDDVDARFDALASDVDDIARTLAVLVTELNARAAVDAALAGRLLPLTQTPAVAPEQRPALQTIIIMVRAAGHRRRSRRCDAHPRR